MGIIKTKVHLLDSFFFSTYDNSEFVYLHELNGILKFVFRDEREKSCFLKG